MAASIASEWRLVAMVSQMDLIHRSVLEGHHAVLAGVRHRLLALLILNVI